MEYYSTMRKLKLCKFAATGIKVEGVVPSTKQYGSELYDRSLANGVSSTMSQASRFISWKQTDIVGIMI